MDLLIPKGAEYDGVLVNTLKDGPGGKPSAFVVWWRNVQTTTSFTPEVYKDINFQARQSFWTNNFSNTVLRVGRVPQASRVDCTPTPAHSSLCQSSLCSRTHLAGLSSAEDTALFNVNACPAVHLHGSSAVYLQHPGKVLACHYLLPCSVSHSGASVRPRLGPLPHDVLPSPFYCISSRPPSRRHRGRHAQTARFARRRGCCRMAPC